jgi:hypothetical protein
VLLLGGAAVLVMAASLFAATSIRLRAAAEVVVAGVGTATVDGQFAPGEWANAGTATVDVALPGGGRGTATLLVMNDASNLYLGFRVTPIVPGVTHVGVWFDNNDGGSSFEDGVSFWSGNGRGFVDEFRCGGAWCADAAAGDRDNGAGAGGTDGGSALHELSHPLASGDAHDLNISAGRAVAFVALVEFFDGGGDKVGGGCFALQGACNILDTSTFTTLVTADPTPPPQPVPTKGTKASARLPQVTLTAGFSPNRVGGRMWRESAFAGVLSVRGSTDRPMTLHFVLRRGSTRLLDQRVHVPGRRFSDRFRLPATLIPGSYSLRLNSSQLLLILPQPPEGVVAEAYGSERPLIRQRAIPSTVTILFANFRFAAPPLRTPLAVRWTLPSGQAGTASNVKNAGAFALSFVKDNKPLPSGKYEAVLIAAGTVVDRLVFSIGASNVLH